MRRDQRLPLPVSSGSRFEDHVERRLVHDAVLTCMDYDMLARARVEVVTDELRVRKGFRHNHRGPAMAASGIGYLGAAFQLVDGAVERREPIAHQVIMVAGTEKAP